MAKELKKNKRCGNCGSSETAPKPSRGPLPWKDYKGVLLEKPIVLLTCQKCGNHLLSGHDIEKLDAAIEESIRAQVAQYIEKILSREECRQIDLAAVLGVTPEHLSAIKNGSRIPSFQTFNFLKTLALNESAYQDAANFPKAMGA